MDYLTHSQDIFDAIRAKNDDRNGRDNHLHYDETTDPHINLLFSVTPGMLPHSSPQAAIGYLYLWQLCESRNIARSYAIVSLKRHLKSLGFDESAIGDTLFQCNLIPF
jgi:hypothetical protein